MNLKHLGLIAVVAIAAFAAPQAASAYYFEPSPGGPLTVDAPNDLVTDFATADVDGNGNEDIIRVGSGKGIHVFLADNDGQGFTPAAGSPFGTGTPGTTRFSVTTGDFGGDSAIDLLVGTGNPHTYETYLGADDGTFPTNPDFTFSVPSVGPDFAAPSGPPAVGDLNEDSRPDLVVPMTAHKFAVALGSATGQFTVTPESPVNVPTTNNLAGESFTAASVGDWNGNGHEDVAFSSSDSADQAPPAIFTAIGNGTGVLIPTGSPVYTQAVFQDMPSIATIDLHTNVWDDLAVASPFTDQVVTLIGSPTGLVANPAPNGTMETGQNTRPISVVNAKLSGDGVADLGISLYADHSLTFAESRGDGNLDLVPGSPFDLPPIGGKEFRPEIVMGGDFDGDDISDLAAYSSDPGDSGIARGIDVMINRPLPVMTPASLNFPATPLGGESDPLTVKLENGGSPNLYINSISIPNNDGKFELDSSACPSFFYGGGRCNIKVVFKPGLEYDTPSANLVITFTGGVEPVSVPLTGHTPARMEPDVDTIDFDETIVGYEPDTGVDYVQINSTGGDALELGNPLITGPDASDFSIENAANCTAAPIPSGSSCTLTVTFAPSSSGFREGYLDFESANDPDPPAPVALEGYGRKAEYTVSPASHDFGEAKVDEVTSRPTQTFTVDSNGAAGVPFTGASVTGANADAFEITLNNCPTQEPIPAHDGSCSITVEFNPTGDAGTRSANLVVDAFSSVASGPATIPLTGTATTDPIPPVGKPKLVVNLKFAAKVKRGKTLVVNAVVKNTGDAAARPLIIKATAPAKMAKAPKPIKVSTLAPGKSITRKLKIKVKRNAPRGRKLTVKVTASSGKVKRTAVRATRVD